MRLRILLPLLALPALAGCGGGTSSVAQARASHAPAAVTVTGQNHVHSILVLPSNPNVIYMGAHYHLYKSTNGGVSWQPLLSEMMLSMAMDPAHPATMFGVSLQSGLLISRDGGKHWARPASAFPKGTIIGVAYDPARKVLFAYGNGVYRSTNGGRSWTLKLSGQSIANVAVGSPGTVYTASGNGLYVTHDDGLHWQSVAALGGQPVIQVAAAGHVAYAAGAISLLRSSNDGKTWKELSKAPNGIEFVGVAPSDPNEIFAEIGGGQGFKVSRNGGQSWATANNGIHDRDFNASTVRVAPSSPKTAYTGAWGLHFYATHDGGRHWKRTAVLVH